jgi:tetratricopeptide (TPR) repeat protein
MRRALLFIACLCSASLMADQSDTRLNELFDVLQHDTDTLAIRRAENRIWEIWLQHPDADVDRLMSLGTQRMNQQRYNDALLIFSQIIERFPEYAEAWNKRATLYYLVGNHDASLADIEKTLALEPRHFGAISGLGMVYIQRHELAKAKQAFEDLLEINPHSPNAQQNLDIVNESLQFDII